MIDLSTALLLDAGADDNATDSVDSSRGCCSLRKAVFWRMVSGSSGLVLGMLNVFQLPTTSAGYHSGGSGLSSSTGCRFHALSLLLCASQTGVVRCTGWLCSSLALSMGVFFLHADVALTGSLPLAVRWAAVADWFVFVLSVGRV